MRGHPILEKLFPGIPADWRVRFDSGIRFLAASRALIDYVVQQRLAAVPSIAVSQGAAVLGLVTDESRNRVIGV
jgi:hypothetical protein